MACFLGARHCCQLLRCFRFNAAAQLAAATLIMLGALYDDDARATFLAARPDTSRSPFSGRPGAQPLAT